MKIKDSREEYIQNTELKLGYIQFLLKLEINATMGKGIKG